MEPQELQSLGLTEGESKVYLALLKIGASSIGTILKESGVSHSKIYDILERLNKKGLIGEATINNRKQFDAKDPSRLMEFIELKEKEIQVEKREAENIIPKLQELQALAAPSEDIEILKGANGIKTGMELLLSSLQKGDFLYLLGAPKGGTEKMWAYFQDFNVRRVKKKAFQRGIYNEDARSWAVERSKSPLTEIRLFSKGATTNAPLIISKSMVLTIIFEPVMMCVMMKHKEIAKSYIDYFNIIWENSEDINKNI